MMRTPARMGFGLAVLLAAGVAATASAAPPADAAPKARTPRPAAPRADDPPYDATGRRDPFRPPRATAIAGTTVTPLQRYEIGQLRLVAVIYDTNAPRAVVEDDAGLGYIIRVGTPIGPNGGQVRAIERGRVLVREESEDFYGEAQTAEVVLELTSGERGKR
ncbi:MAG: pilus assembly protein PilP [bacterium]|nr:pilus assembly protein PilP [bacterium]